MEEDKERRAFAKRLNDICDAMDVPPKGKNRQAELARIMGVSQKGARKWLEGEGLPTLEKCIALARWAGVGTEWLLTGRGPMEPKSLRVDQYSSRVLTAMEPLPDYLKEAAVSQVETLRDANDRKGS